MSLETSRIDSAHSDKALVSVIRENFRNHLLMALSEARSATLKMESRFREKLMDDLSKQFHPDSDWMRDAFTEAFHPVIETIDEHIESLTDDLAMARRELGIRHAAE